MHQTILILVDTPDRDDAASTAMLVLEDLVFKGIFDYGNPIEQPVTDDEARKLIDEAYKAQRGRFEHNMNALRNILSRFDNDELYNDVIERDTAEGDTARHMFRPYTRWVSESEGADILLYDENGCGIWNQAEFDTILAAEYLWAVPMDVHI